MGTALNRLAQRHGMPFYATYLIQGGYIHRDKYTLFAFGAHPEIPIGQMLRVN